MQEILDKILTFNLIGSTAIFYVAARLYVLPRLGDGHRAAFFIALTKYWR